jgi:ribosomal protein S7
VQVQYKKSKITYISLIKYLNILIKCLKIKVKKQKQIKKKKYIKFILFLKKQKQIIFNMNKENIKKYLENILINFKNQLQLNDLYDNFYLLRNFENYVKNILENKILNKVLKFNSNFNFDVSFFLSKPSNLLFFNKMSNLLMLSGNKSKSENILIAFLKRLKFKYKILNPLKILQEKLYVNIVPSIRTRKIGFRNVKTIGINVAQHYRFNKSLKLFIKGAKTHKTSIITGLIIEFFNLLKNKSKLNEYNRSLLKEIEKNRLINNVQILK